MALNKATFVSVFFERTFFYLTHEQLTPPISRSQRSHPFNIKHRPGNGEWFLAAPANRKGSTLITAGNPFFWKIQSLIDL